MRAIVDRIRRGADSIRPRSAWGSVYTLIAVDNPVCVVINANNLLRPSSHGWLHAR